MKIRCENCDAVTDAEKKTVQTSWFSSVDMYKCPYCLSVRTETTNEPYRPPKWERDTTQEIKALVKNENGEFIWLKVDGVRITFPQGLKLNNGDTLTITKNIAF